MDATAYLLAGTPEAEHNVAQNAAKQIEGGTAKLVNIILSTKDYIAGDDLTQEAKAIEYLAAVLRCLDRKALSRQDIALMINYLEARMSTPYSPGVKDTAVGLEALVAQTRYNPSDSIEICRSVFSNSPHFNEYTASVRIEVYRLLDTLLNSNRDGLKEHSGEFIVGLISLAELEKDPRNLMIYFSMLHVVLSEWEIGDHAKDLWDAVSKYFPITFRPRPDDPIGITADDLKQRLRLCISATSEFAPWVFSFLIEKLDDQVTANVKKDVMQTMRRCIIRYGWRPAGNWSSQIWDALKYEVLNATEDELADEALSVLQTLSGCLSLEETTLQTLENTVLYKYISAIVKECVKHFKEPQQKYAKEAGKIVGKVASGSAHSFHLVVKEVFPTLLTILQDTPALTKKRELLEVFNKVLDARLDLAEKDEGKSSETLDTIIDTFQVTSLVDKSAYEGLTLFRDNLFEIFTLNLSSPPKEEVALRTSAARGLLRLVKIPKFLTPNEVGMIIQHLNIVILDREDSGLDLRDESIRSLQEVAKLYPQDVADITFPALLGTLPDVADADGVMTHLPALEALSKIASANCEANVLFEILVRRLTRKFEDVIRQGESQFYARMILVGLLYGFGQLELACKKLSSAEQTLAKKRIHDQNGYVVKYLCQFVTVSGYNITADGERHYIGLRSLKTAKGSEFADDHLLEVIGKICMTVIRFMDVKDQHSVGLEVFNLFAEIPPKVSKTVVRENQLDFLNSTKDQQRTLILSMYLLAGLNRKVLLYYNLQKICCDLIQCFYKPENFTDRAYESIVGILALITNKWDAPAPEFQPTTYKCTPEEIVVEIIVGRPPVPDSVAAKALRMTVIYTMACNLRNHPMTHELILDLILQLADQNRGAQLAKDFQYLLAPSDLLCKENSAIMRPLYKQRPFALCMHDFLIDYEKCSDKSVKSNYLVALAGVLKYTPSEVILPAIEHLIPVLLQGMETPGSGVKAASIDVLLTAIAQSPASVEGHMRSIIKRLIDRIHNTIEAPSDSPAAVRGMALRCLAAIPGHIKETITLPHKLEVLRELECAVNDGKRSVRDEAVHCRYIWFNLTEDAEDDE